MQKTKRKIKGKNNPKLLPDTNKKAQTCLLINDGIIVFVTSKEEPKWEYGDN